MQSVRVGLSGRYEGDIVTKDQQEYQFLKEKYKDKILVKFKSGIKIKRIFRDIAWEVFKEADIDAMK